MTSHGVHHQSKVPDEAAFFKKRDKLIYQIQFLLSVKDLTLKHISRNFADKNFSADGWLLFIRNRLGRRAAVLALAGSDVKVVLGPVEQLLDFGFVGVPMRCGLEATLGNRLLALG